MNIKLLLSQGNWVFVNKTLIQLCGLEASTVVGYFSSKEIDEDGWFVCTFEEIEMEIGIKPTSSRTGIANLKNQGVLESKREGLPCKTWYRLNEEKLMEIFGMKSISSPPEKCMTSNTESKGTSNTENCGTFLIIKKNKNNILKNITKRTKFSPTKKESNPSPKSNNIIFDFYSDYSFFKKEFSKIWFDEFLPLKLKKKASISERALKSQLSRINEYSGGDYEKAKQILEKSVNSGWADIYPLKQTIPRTGTRSMSGKSIQYNDGIKINRK